jgi:hypothetical protein
MKKKERKIARAWAGRKKKRKKKNKENKVIGL